MLNNHYVCGAHCGALIGIGISLANAGWFRNEWNLKRLMATSGAIVIGSSAIGALIMPHSAMALVQPFADCGTVGMAAFGLAAGTFKLLIDESIYGNYKAFAASLAVGLATTYVAAQFI
jgi:hypothetical protein